MLDKYLNQVLKGHNLSREESMDAMASIMEGKATAAQIAGFMTAMRMKGESVEEITGFVMTMREKAVSVDADPFHLVDTCGTGGDGGKTFNISTASAIVAAAGGVRVAKHGNRAISSRSGSADVLEALGIPVQLNAEQARRLLEETHLCFLFAPLYHHAMKYAAGPRKELGFRSFFNLLGPLTNPAGADRQLIGVYDVNLVEKVALVLREIGLKKALVVAGTDGLDEISISAPTRVAELNGQSIQSYDITPEEMGLDRYSLSQVAGGTSEENARMIQGLLSGEKGAHRDIVCLNSGAVFYLDEKADSIQEGVQLARRIIDSGRALDKLNQLRLLSGEVSNAS
ncbi:MAG: anthranilate phosphoribosyltransferase [Bacillaceae bacterium]|nr:anthranilate phosphoribosyltransferase [Bacillaceae bacterium]